LYWAEKLGLIALIRSRWLFTYVSSPVLHDRLVQSTYQPHELNALVIESPMEAIELGGPV
jgi:hypothetical protein